MLELDIVEAQAQPSLDRATKAFDPLRTLHAGPRSQSNNCQVASGTSLALFSSNSSRELNVFRRDPPSRCSAGARNCANTRRLPSSASRTSAPREAGYPAARMRMPSGVALEDGVLRLRYAPASPWTARLEFPPHRVAMTLVAAGVGCFLLRILVNVTRFTIANGALHVSHGPLPPGHALSIQLSSIDGAATRCGARDQRDAARSRAVPMLYSQQRPPPSSRPARREDRA